MKKVEPKDLIVGQEYYVKMRLTIKDKSIVPYYFEDEAGVGTWFPHNQPIYTASEPVATTESDIDLSMVVEVAISLYVAHGTTADGVNKFMPDRDQIAREAIDLYNACKKAVKEGER